MRRYWLIAALILASPVAARPHDFTFRDAEFLPLDDGIEAAQRFVAERLPAGLPLDVARERLRQADMRCARRPRHGTIDCDFTEVVHVEGGVLGEQHWTVALTTDATGALRTATFNYAVIGAGSPGL